MDSPEPEMTSLKQIKDKLDTLAESQGKLLAALNDLDAKVMAIGNCLGEILELATKPRVKPKRKKISLDNLSA